MYFYPFICKPCKYFLKRRSFLITEKIFLEFRNAFRGICFPKLDNIFLVFQKKNTIKKTMSA